MHKMCGPGQLRLKSAPNFAQSDLGQAYTQALRALTRARVMTVSGAATRPVEYEKDATIYFAEPGDTKERLQQKRRSRLAIMAGLKQEAGRAFQEYFGEEGPSREDVFYPPTRQPAGAPAYTLPNGTVVRR